MEARIPDVGEVLVHGFRRREGEVRAEVTAVDREGRPVRVLMDGREYASLSVAVGGTSQNGWVYWGLKKQTPRDTST